MALNIKKTLAAFVVLGVVGSLGVLHAQKAPESAKDAPGEAAAPATGNAEGAKTPAQRLAFLPETVAKVGEETISSAEVVQAVVQRLSRARASLTGKNALPDQVLRSLAFGATQQLVNSRLMAQKAREEGYVPAKKLAEEQFAKWEEQAGKDKVEAMMKQQGITRDKMLEELGRQLGVKKWMDEQIEGNVEVAEEEVRAFYDENGKRFEKPARKSASHILVKVERAASEKERKAAKLKAKGLKKQLDEGADFAELAKQKSDCPSSKQGGDLGFFQKGKMMPAFEKAAFALKEGELSDVVETRAGYHIIKGGEGKPADKVSYEEAKPRIEKRLKGQRAQKVMKSLVGMLRQNAKVEVFLEQPKRATPERPAPQTGG